jgi:hypothetical protein
MARLVGVNKEMTDETRRKQDVKMTRGWKSFRRKLLSKGSYLEGREQVF